jgi:Domain of unknown function (DUF4387)
MSELWELTSLIRSKNAGPFELTFDIIFKNRAGFDLAKESDIFSRENISKLYNVPPDGVRVFELVSILAVKVSIPRPVFSGDVNDTDVYGGQFHSRLVQLVVGIPIVIAIGQKPACLQ